MKVTSVGEGVTVGIAVAFAWWLPIAGEYVLVARPEATISPGLALTEVLKAYGGTEGDGVGTRKLGRTVLTFADADAKYESTS